ncbi:hypothetical protein Hdeb2414_s0243g00845571 [Helianthus debilis subsp. tardiflorus]
MTRKGGTTKCGKCGNLGKNSRSCKGQGGTTKAGKEPVSQSSTQGAPQVTQE